MASWQTPLCPFEIVFPDEKLDEIRIAVIEGYYAVRRGGIEVGGVLFGTKENDRVTIVDFRKIKTEYETGPSFQLSETDKEGLRRLLADSRFKDPNVKPVGWFHSHTRSGIYLSEKDLELYHEFFPEPWQVALVLKPENLGPVTGGYFFRAADGTVKADASTLEFTLQPMFVKKWTAADAIPEVPKAEQAPAVERPIRVPFEAMLQELSQEKSWWRARSGHTFLVVFLLGVAVFSALFSGYLTATR
jgi:proteasome lid subunit RPN8/RPN11